MADLTYVISIFQKPPETRDTKQIANVIAATKNYDFFIKIGEEAHKKCCEQMNHEFIPSKSFVFKAGDFGSTFYIVLKGTVSVIVDLPKEEIQPNGESAIIYHPVEVAKKKPGDSFGELSLIDNCPRSASIQCIDDCHFGVLDKQQYKKILQEIEIEILNSKVEFIWSIPMFQFLRKRQIHNLVYFFESKKFRKNEVVYVEGSLPTHMYIIKQGEVNFFKKIQIEEPYNGIDIQSVQEQLPTRNLNRNKIKEVNIMQLRTGEIFGEGDLYFKRQKRNSKAVCSSKEVELLLLSKHDFEKKLQTMPDVDSFLNEMTQKKDEFLENRIKMIFKTYQNKCHLVTQIVQTVTPYEEYKFESGAEVIIDMDNLHKKATEEFFKRAITNKPFVNRPTTSTTTKTDQKNAKFERPQTSGSNAKKSTYTTKITRPTTAISKISNNDFYLTSVALTEQNTKRDDNEFEAILNEKKGVDLTRISVDSSIKADRAIRSMFTKISTIEIGTNKSSQSPKNENFPPKNGNYRIKASYSNDSKYDKIYENCKKFRPTAEVNEITNIMNIKSSFKDKFFPGNNKFKLITTEKAFRKGENLVYEMNKSHNMKKLFDRTVRKHEDILKHKECLNLYMKLKKKNANNPFFEFKS